MASAPDRRVGTEHQPVHPRPLASWYTQGRSDGIGDRLLMSDTSGTALELLRFRPEFAATYGFERSLRERVELVDRVRHAAFPQVHAVEYLEEREGLALVTTHVPGKRLSELFQAVRPRAGLHPAFAVWLIRELTSAIAELQSRGLDVAHGALSPDRLVITPDGRVAIVEHVLGSALACLELSSSRLWTDVGVIVPPAGAGRPRLDQRADVVQIGLIALSVLLGRRLTPADYPHRLPELMEEFSQLAARRSAPLVAPLRLWLDRALRTDGRGFRSARDARGGLAELPDGAGPHTSEESRTRERSPSSDAAPRREDPQPILTIVPPPQPAPLDEAEAGRPSAIEPQEALQPDQPAPAPLPRSQKARRPWLAPGLAAAFATIAAGEGLVLVRVLSQRPVMPTPPAVSVPLLVDAVNTQDVVLVDGVQAGPAPLQIRVTGASGVHTIRVFHQDLPAPDPSRDRDAPSRSGAGSRTEDRAPAVPPPARPRSGGLRLVSPVDLQVLEGDRVLGSSADGPVVTTAGVHELDFVNSALGFRLRQSVDIKAGRIVSLQVVPPKGRISANAVPWAQVWIDGTLVGETPLANVPVAAGEHEVVFRHPQLGERRQAALVRAGALTRVSATLGP